MSTIILLTTKQSRRVNALVRKLCCNYDNGYCLLLDDGEKCVCPQLITFSHIICKWFKAAVLPVDKELYIELMKPPNTKQCSVCGKFFLVTGNNSKYCSDCRKIMRNRKQAEYMRKKRWNC